MAASRSFQASGTIVRNPYFRAVLGEPCAAIWAAGLGGRAAQRRGQEAAPLETGAIEEEDFELQFAAELGVNAPQLIDRLFAGSGPDQSMLDAVRRARLAGIRTGLISNSWGTRRYDRALLGELFDGVVISGEVGIRKPAREIYELGTEQIGLAADACVLVDDLPSNLDPARALGMETVHHVNSEKTIAELERLLGVELS